MTDQGSTSEEPIAVEIPTEESNPALAPPPPPEPQEKTYEVIGTQNVFDHRPGETFSATLSKQQEEDLTQYGHLKVVADQAQPEVPEAPVEEESPVTESTTKES